MKQELRHTSPFLKAVVGSGLLTSSRAPTIQSRRGHQCGVSKGSALRLRLTGSVVQPLSCYDLLTYKAIGSNYLSFVVTSMLVFHIATGWSRNCDSLLISKLAYLMQNKFNCSWKIDQRRPNPQVQRLATDPDSTRRDLDTPLYKFKDPDPSVYNYILFLSTKTKSRPKKNKKGPYSKLGHFFCPNSQQRLNQFLSTKDARVHSSNAHVHYHVHMCTSHMHMCTSHVPTCTCTLEVHMHFRSARAHFKRFTCTSSVRALFKRKRVVGQLKRLACTSARAQFRR